MKSVAVVLSGGRGKRMNTSVPKQYLDVCGKPVLYYSLKAFQDSIVDEIILVTSKEDIEYVKENIVDKYNLSKVKKIVCGGKERYNSVFCGLDAIDNADYVLIHDGARPFVTDDIINNNISALSICDGCVTAVQSKDTVKISDEKDFVASTPERDRVWMVQTPQSFKFDIIYKAYKQLVCNEKIYIDKGIKITDDAMVAEYITDIKIKFINGDYRNIKITTPEDLIIAKAYIEAGN